MVDIHLSTGINKCHPRLFSLKINITNPFGRFCQYFYVLSFIAQPASSIQPTGAKGKSLAYLNIGTQPAQSQWRFFSQYGKIYPDNLWVFTPPGSPTRTPQPLPPTPHTKKILWLSTIKPANDRAAWLRGVKKPKKGLCFTVLQRTQTKTSKLKLKLTVEKYCIHNFGKDPWKVNNFTSK